MDASSPGFPEGAKVPRVVRAVFPIYRGVISSVAHLVAHLQVGGVVDLLLQFAGSLLGGERLPRGAGDREKECTL
jgi:hypothetical protein